MKLRSPPLFWRTLLLVLLLIVASLAAWLQSFRVFERAPRAETVAQQIVSIAQLTRAALLYADPYDRRELLAELARNEGIRIFPLEPADVITPLPDRPILQLAAQSVSAKLGPGTRVVAAVNGTPGLWVSLAIDEDRYWLLIERDPVARSIGTQWIGWAAVALLLSVLGAILITRVINRPLARLSDAARELGAGRTPPPLPAAGPAEIRTVNDSFNRMVMDLGKLEEDRAVLLAGISHDLRTPLTRMRLELEMAKLPEEARAAMIGDIEQMDAIVRQFLDYARRSPQQPAEAIDLSGLVDAAVARSRIGQEENSTVTRLVAQQVGITGYRTELDRALDNLLVNAARYGRDPATGRLDVTVSLTTDGQEAVVGVADRGPGVPAGQIERLLRPFERGDSARSGSGGAGLGLPIVQRIARLHGGTLRLLANAPHGLRAELTLPLEREA
jgi:two-component system, OmpR family, osmolarity sensor histidine kinase EnvZ